MRLKQSLKLMHNAFYKWFELTLQKESMKIKRANAYYILKKKRKIFILWKKIISDEKFFKRIDMIFLQLETIASSWIKE